jgi:hypothetical protein
MVSRLYGRLFKGLGQLRVAVLVIFVLAHPLELKTISPTHLSLIVDHTSDLGEHPCAFASYGRISWHLSLY